MKNIVNFFGLLKHDIRTMHWPKKEDLIKSYFIVLATALVLGLYIFGLDYFFTAIYQKIIF